LAVAGASLRRDDGHPPFAVALPPAKCANATTNGAVKWKMPSKEQAETFFERFSANDATRLLVNRKYEEAVRILAEGLAHYRERLYLSLSAQDMRNVDAFVGFMLHALTCEELVVPDSMAGYLVSHNHIVSNLVAMSSYRTTDPQIRILLRQSRNFLKLLILYNPRNSIWLDPSAFFRAGADLASIWYTRYPLSGCGVTEQSLENVRKHFSHVDEHFTISDDAIAPPYFGVTYVLPENDRYMKSEFNKRIQAMIGAVPINNHPRRRSVAIVTAKWFSGSAVYRSLSPYVYSLSNHYDLTLIHLGPKRDNLDTSKFSRVLHVATQGANLDLSDVATNDFQVAYYPDIGMTPESILLSNIRLAPIQAVGYGHPVSTFGSKIDYFIGGTDTEVPELASQNYSERLVLLPGLGAHPVYPDYTPKLPARSTNTITINCSWGNSKYTYPLLLTLRRMRERSKRPIQFQFFPAWGLERYNAVTPFIADVAAALGESSAKVLGNRAYAEYMAYMEYGDLSLDSYPFGGYNTIVDSLYLGKPIVAYEGDRFFNKAAAALLRRIGLDELIAHNDEEYVEKAVRLINDDLYRLRLSAFLRSIDLHEKLFDTDEPQYFHKAIDYLIAHHDELSHSASHEPIWIR
jgi:hypothetical protein